MLAAGELGKNRMHIQVRGCGKQYGGGFQEGAKKDAEFTILEIRQVALGLDQMILPRYGLRGLARDQRHSRRWLTENILGKF